MKPEYLLPFVILAFGARPLGAADSPTPNFRAVEIDSKVEIGYGVVVADVDGDKKPDILLADKKQFVWYRNPDWQKFILAENLTRQDNVCIAAADIDGDGKAEVAVGAEWNPGDTVNSGAVFYLVAPNDRTQRWEPVELPHEPTVHRMRWVRNPAGQFGLVVVPLHGRANRNGEGTGVKILSYNRPTDPHTAWSTNVIADTLHMTHNFELVTWNRRPGDEVLVAAKEGIFHFTPGSDGWKTRQLTGKTADVPAYAGAGEVRASKGAGVAEFIAAIEPMHGNQLVIYTPPGANDTNSFWRRTVLDSSLKEGHALACADFLGTGSDQIVVGWRTKNDQGKTGIKLFYRPEKEGQWKSALLDDDTMACEDLCAADLNGDGKMDIVASGRATKNLKIYFNQRQ